MLNLMKHKRNTLQLTPRGGLVGLGGGSGDTGVLAACGPDFFGFGHAVLEVGVDFGDFGLGDHGCCWFVRWWLKNLVGTGGVEKYCHGGKQNNERWREYTVIHKCIFLSHRHPALLAQLGERQTEDLKVLCSIHRQSNCFAALNDLNCRWLWMKQFFAALFIKIKI